MTKLETALCYTTVKDEASRITAIVVCGGSSSRMNGIDKMFVDVCGVPVCVRSIKAFQACDAVSDIVVVTKEDSVLKIQQYCEKFNLFKVSDIVIGGSCRQQSVANGLAVVSDKTDIVLIHDGARPFVSLDCIKRVIDGALKYSAVTCAVIPKDTIKVAKTDGLVTSTLTRDELRSVQTPQGFEFGLYKKAVEANKDRLADFTDDCSLVESFGYAVYTVDGDYKNIKITTSEDLQIAHIFAKDDK